MRSEFSRSPLRQDRWFRWALKVLLLAFGIHDRHSTNSRHPPGWCANLATIATESRQYSTLETEHWSDQRALRPKLGIGLFKPLRRTFEWQTPTTASRQTGPTFSVVNLMAQRRKQGSAATPRWPVYSMNGVDYWRVAVNASPVSPVNSSGVNVEDIHHTWFLLQRSGDGARTRF